jgi:hypothetical protein
MLQGETIMSGANPECCGKKLTFKVLQSAAGYYIGTQCQNCGPYSMESNYFKDGATADVALKQGTWNPRR